MKQGSKKACKMLQLWKRSATKESFTYAVLADALEKNGFQNLPGSIAIRNPDFFQKLCIKNAKINELKYHSFY